MENLQLRREREVANLADRNLSRTSYLLSFRRTGVADPHHYLDTNPYVRDGENPDPDLWCELCSVAHGLDFTLKRKGRREICTVHVE